MQCKKPFHTVKATANEKIPNGNYEGLICKAMRHKNIKLKDLTEFNKCFPNNIFQ